MPRRKQASPKRFPVYREVTWSKLEIKQWDKNYIKFWDVRGYVVAEDGKLVSKGSARDPAVKRASKLPPESKP